MRTFAPEVEDALIQSQDAFVWEAPAFEPRQRGTAWYFVMALVAVFFMAYAVWTANFLFAFIVLLSAILLLLVGNKPPKVVLIQVGDNGIVFDGRLILYQDIDNFAVLYQPPSLKVLYVERRSPTAPRLNILLEDQDPVAIRNFLKQYVKEDLNLQNEHLSDIVARLLKI